MVLTVGHSKKAQMEIKESWKVYYEADKNQFYLCRKVSRSSEGEEYEGWEVEWFCSDHLASHFGWSIVEPERCEDFKSGILICLGDL